MKTSFVRQSSQSANQQFSPLRGSLQNMNVTASIIYCKYMWHTHIHNVYQFRLLSFSNKSGEVIVKSSMCRIYNIICSPVAFPMQGTTRHYYRPIRAEHTLTAVCIAALCVHCKQAMNTIPHNAWSSYPLRYQMRMPCYFLVQGSRKYFCHFNRGHIHGLLMLDVGTLWQWGRMKVMTVLHKRYSSL